MTQKGGVHIGSVGGSIKNSIIAGRDVSNVTITVGGQPTPADKEPSSDEFTQLLADIQKELTELTAQKEAFQAVSPAAPFTAMGAEQSIKDVVAKVETDMEPEEAESVQNSLKEATTLLSGILDGAITVAEKADEVGNAVKPLTEKLEPLVEKLAVAALWAGKLWLLG